MFDCNCIGKLLPACFWNPYVLNYDKDQMRQSITVNNIKKYVCFSKYFSIIKVAKNTLTKHH